MKKVSLILALALIFGTAAAQAATITLTFEGLGNNAPVGNYYGGGAGPNYGITFGPDALALISGLVGGSGNFSGAPTMPTIMYFLTGVGDVMNVPAGFTTGFSFYYTAINNPGVVNVYDALNGTGTLLASFNLPVTPSQPGTPGCPYGQFCPFVPIGVTFSGTAESVVFGGSSNQIGFDNITLGSGIPTPGVPEPGTLVMFGSGVIGLAGMLRRKFNV